MEQISISSTSSHLKWKPSKHKTIIKKTTPPNLTFYNQYPYNLLITSNTIDVIDLTQGEIIKSISNFKGVALCSGIRNDDLLICNGSLDGIVRVFD